MSKLSQFLKDFGRISWAFWSIADSFQRYVCYFQKTPYRKATTLGGMASAIPKGTPIMAQIEKLDYQSDKVDALLRLSPDGKLDAAPTWTGVNNADQSPVSPEVSPDGKSAIVRLPTDVDRFDFNITATAPVDDPATPDIEEVSSVFHIAGEHSKATDLGGTADTVAKGAGFP